jgi:hypothetical protein
MPTLRMSAAIPLLPANASTAWAGTALPFYMNRGGHIQLFWKKTTVLRRRLKLLKGRSRSSIVDGSHLISLWDEITKCKTHSPPPPPHGATAPVGQGLIIIIEASQSHSHTTHSVGLLWTSDQPDAETPTCQHTTFTRDKTSMFPVGSEPAIPATQRP